MSPVIQQAPGGVMPTETDMNPILQAITWLLLSLSSLVVIFWFLTKFYIKSRSLFMLGDGLMLGSYLFGLGESIALIVPGSAAFGKDIATLSKEQLDDADKIGYTRDILFLLSLGLSKLSACEGVRALSPDRIHHLLTSIIALSVVIWMITSVFGTAFQCGASGPWDRDHARCINQASRSHLRESENRRLILVQDAFLRFVYISSVVIDAGLVTLPIAIISPLQMTLRLRLTVMSFFSFRVIVIAGAIVQLVYLDRLWVENYTLLAFPYYLSTQLVLFASLLAAYIIYFWPFLRSMQSGLMSANAATLTSRYPLTRTSKRPTLKAVMSSHITKRGYIEIIPTLSLARLAPSKTSSHTPPAQDDIAHTSPR
ncbi:hypothetical protein ANO14919_098870 [Xylariales sp. No.14919]|nr:hypothetical protein ANO14919_098870 [Xylariales sp. No.14919]